MASPMVKKLLMDKKPIIPANLKPNVLAWWDARERGQVFYGLNQIVANGNFVNTTGWTAYASALSATGGVLAATGDGSHEYLGAYAFCTGYLAASAKFYLRGEARVRDAAATKIELQALSSGTVTTVVAQTINTPTADNWYPLSGIASMGAGTGDIGIRVRSIYADGATANGKILEVRNLRLYPVSIIMGAGNEPTAAEMDAILTADGNQYWEGTRQVLCNPDNKYYWKDYSGNGRHMKLNGFAYSGASGWQSPYGLGTDGVDDYGRYVMPEFNPNANGISIFAVFSIPNTTGSKYIGIGSNASEATAPIALYVSGSNLTARVTDSVSGDTAVTFPIQVNKKYFAIASYDPTTKTVTLFVNSIPITSTAITNGILTITRIKTGINAGDAIYSSDSMSLIGFINKKTTAYEAKQLYDNNKRRFGL